MHGRVRRIVTNVFLMRHPLPARTRVRLMRALGYDIAPTAVIRSRTLIKTSHMTVGDRSFINHSCFVDDGEVVLGAGVYVGPRTIFATTTHEIGPSSQRAGRSVTSSIQVGDGCWIGANVTLVAGVHVAAGCVVAAGAVVNRSTEVNGLYAGVPARRIRDLPA